MAHDNIRSKNGGVLKQRTIGPVANLEQHLPIEWWRNIFNSLYLKTDGDVVENETNTATEIDLVVKLCELEPHHQILDLCCGQGRHSLELASRGYRNVMGIDRSRYLIRLARRRQATLGLKGQFSEGDARKFRVAPQSKDCILIMGNSFGYFDREEDDTAVLESVKRSLKAGGKLFLDIVDGEWMKSHFEKRSWEWIDQSHFVNRERSLGEDGKRIISREIICHAEKGVLADQFYAERLYSKSEISNRLQKLGFLNVTCHGNIAPDSSRNQDLGMMGNRLILTAVSPQQSYTIQSKAPSASILVLLGDPRLPDAVKREGKFSEADFETVQQMKDALSQIQALKVDYIDNHEDLQRRLTNRKRPDIIFNLCDEGFRNDPLKELHVPSMLETLDIPYTGAGPACLAICYRKSMVRAIADTIEVPVPAEAYYDSADPAANIPSEFPVLVKPDCGDSSVGITRHAVVNSAQKFLEYIQFLSETLPGQNLLIQEYLPGTEYSVAVIGNRGNFEVLPILEVDYSQLPSDLPPILSYESKWEPDSPYWDCIKYRKAQLDEEMVRTLEHYSLKLFEKFECLDYARFDFRCNGKGDPKLLEVNPNPGWCWDGKLNLMAGFAGLSYAELLKKIINVGLARWGIDNILP
ncbi:MAG: methyltransferase domain-containing protein [Deltaproteobacteria bacterium]|nr:methyltransferase domain-containing protein [Deltaproteobacteria bacterium]